MKDETLEDYLERNNLFLCKNLTDEKIADIISSGEYWELDEHLNIVAVHFDKFARAILRKAQK
jgi:hypothetical protein